MAVVGSESVSGEGEPHELHRVIIDIQIIGIILLYFILVSPNLPAKKLRSRGFEPLQAEPKFGNNTRKYSFLILANLGCLSREAIISRKRFPLDFQGIGIH
jgi:hypothetical protein